MAETARSLRSHAMTSGTWDRHRGHSAGYDVVGLGFNYRMDEPRAALLSARLHGLADDIAKRRRLVHRYRALLRDVSGVTVPYRDEEVDSSSCYVMPVMVDRAELRDPLRAFMLERAPRPDERALPRRPRVQRLRRAPAPAAPQRARRAHAS